MKGEIEILVITIVKYHIDFSTLYFTWESMCINKESKRGKGNSQTDRAVITNTCATMEWRDRRKGSKTAAGQIQSNLRD